MGNQAIGIGLKLDSTTYQAGAVVKGVVYLKIQPDSNERLRSIGLILEGEERTAVTFTETVSEGVEENEISWEQQNAHQHYSSHRHHHHRHHNNAHQFMDSQSHCCDSGNQSCRNSAAQENERSKPVQRTITKVERDHATLIRVDVSLAQFFQPLLPGQYEYPFQWELPQNLPASVQATGPNESHCEIHYQVTAFYTTAASHRTYDAHNFAKRSAKQEIKIAAHPTPVHALRTIREEEQFPISSCCCFRKGLIDLGFTLDRNVLSPCSTATIQLVGKNLSQVTVSQLQVSLLEHVKWSAKNHTEQVTTTLLQENFPTVGLPQWKPQRNSRNHHTHEELQSQEVLLEPIQLTLNIPPRARNSYIGNLLEVSHSLAVTACTPFHVTTPCLQTSVQVGPVIGENLGVIALSSQTEVVNRPQPTQVTSPTSVPLAEAEWLLPEDWNGQTADVIFIPPSSVLVDPLAAVASAEKDFDDDPSITLRPPPVAPTAPSESLLEYAPELERLSHNQVMPCDLGELEAFLLTIPNVELLPYRLNEHPSMMARVQMITPRQFVGLLHLSNTYPGTEAASRDKPTANVARGRVLAALMGETFQCRHVVACLWGCAVEYRLDILRELVPLAADWTTHRETVERELESAELSYLRSVTNH